MANFICTARQFLTLVLIKFSSLGISLETKFFWIFRWWNIFTMSRGAWDIIPNTFFKTLMAREFARKYQNTKLLILSTFSMFCSQRWDLGLFSGFQFLRINWERCQCTFSSRYCGFSSVTSKILLHTSLTSLQKMPCFLAMCSNSLQIDSLSTKSFQFLQTRRKFPIVSRNFVSFEYGINFTTIWKSPGLFINSILFFINLNVALWKTKSNWIIVTIYERYRIRMEFHLIVIEISK